MHGYILQRITANHGHISKTFLCASGGWYILGLSRELDAVRRSGLCGMV